MTGETSRIYIAGRVPEAKRVEDLLTRHGIEYTIEIEPYTTRLLGVLPRKYQGAVFLVLSSQADFCRDLLRKAELTKGLIEDE